MSMTPGFEKYRRRKIEFHSVQRSKDWAIKVYTITMLDEFKSMETIDSALAKLPILLEAAENTNLPVHGHSFLIIHEARECVWILLNWWTGGEMIATRVYSSAYKIPSQILPTPYTSSLVCVWELEIFVHERSAWIQHVLENPDKPEFSNYLNDVLR